MRTIADPAASRGRIPYVQRRFIEYGKGKAEIPQRLEEAL